MYTINFSSSLKVLGVKTKITNVFDAIKGGEYANDISIYRDMLKNDKEMANHYKKQLACFTVSGCFIDRRNTSNLENYNSIIHLDYDLKDEDKAKEISNDIQHCKQIAKENTNLVSNFSFWFMSPTAQTQYEDIYRKCLINRGHSVLN